MTLTRFRPVIFLLSGNLLGAAVGGVFFLTATQRFSLEEMGHYAVAISFQWVMFGIFGTGLSIATIRFARDYYAVDDRAGATSVMTQAAIGVVDHLPEVVPRRIGGWCER
jgi:O-antigen/teichoic acid export membrane protein